MNYYLKDWFNNLKKCGSFEINSNNYLKTNNELDPRSKNVLQRLMLLFTSTTSFLSINCLLLCFLTKYISTGDKQFGLMFLLVTFVVLTCCLFFYPSYDLISIGYINLRIMRWIYSITAISVFFFLVRNYTQICSNLVLCGTLGIKFFREMPFRFPKTFTYNELLILSSFVSCGLFTFISHLSKIAEKDEVIIIEHALVWLVLVFFFTKKIGKRSLFLFVFGCILMQAVYFFPICLNLTQKNPYIWLFEYLFFSGPKRILIFCYWLSLFSLMTLIILMIKVQIKTDENFLQNNKLTKIRKIFHLLILVVFLLGFMNDRSLLLLCSYGMLILLLLLEIIRYFKIEPIGTLVQEFLEIFLDEKDTNSSLILSHIYLLIGLAFPFWFSDIKEFNIAELSGFITVGIGDSFAALIGSKFGKHKFPGSNKSVEGSIAMIFSQLIFYIILFKIGLVDLTHGWNLFFITLSLILSVYMELFTNDNDNLILPVIIYPFLNLIK